MATKLKVSIDRNATGNTFTNYDIVQGVVELQVLNAIKLNSIEVFLEGISKSRICYKEGSGQANHNREVINKHKQVFQELTVFPPFQDKNVKSRQEYTLEVGTYKYLFSFQMPMDNACFDTKGIESSKDCPDKYTRVQDHGRPTFKGAFNSWKWSSKSSGETMSHIVNQLPPSFYMGEDANIKYTVRASLVTTQTFHGERTACDPLVFLPLDLDGQQDNTSEYEVSVRESFLCARMVHSPGIPLHFFFELRLSDPAIFIPGEMQTYTLHIGTRHQFIGQSTTAMPTIFLTKIKTSLICITEIRAVDDRLTRTLHKTQKVEKLTLLEKDLKKYAISLSNMELKKEKEIYSLEIPAECYSHSIPTNLPPNFETCNLSRTYRLEVVITYAFDPHAKKGFLHLFQLGSMKKVKLKGEGVRIVSGVYLNHGSVNTNAPLFEGLSDNESEHSLPSYGEVKDPTGQLVRRDYQQEKGYYLK